MIPMKIQKAGSLWLLACLLFASGCDNTQKKKVSTPPINENAVDKSKVDSTASTVPQQTEHTFIVEINKMKFNPDQLTVHKGDTVVWVNNDLTNHCVTETNKAWTSGALVPGKFWQKVITKNEDYFCAIHVVMKGKVQVEQN